MEGTDAAKVPSLSSVSLRSTKAAFPVSTYIARKRLSLSIISSFIILARVNHITLIIIGCICQILILAYLSKCCSLIQVSLLCDVRTSFSQQAILDLCGVRKQLSQIP